MFLFHNNFGLHYRESNFSLDLIRPVQPKSLNLNSNSQFLELLYVINDRTAFSISFAEQIADTQFIDCYSFNNLTIGFCEEAQISIRNSKDKYKPLDDSSIMMIDGRNEEFQLKLYRASNYSFIDEYEFYFSLSENNFNWLSPIEEMTSGFFANLSYQGSTIGGIVSNEINRLPQRDKWSFYKLGLNLNKDIEITPKVNIFYDFDLVFVESKDYEIFNSIPSHNIKIDSGLRLNIFNNLSLSLYGSIYKNNLFGYEDISFTQRSEHHFDKPFGSINSSIKFTF